MGREAIAVCRWKGQEAEVKALLESTEIILRGDIRARIPRTAISAVAVAKDVLSFKYQGAVLRLVLGRVEAEKWALKLALPTPTLGEKLGVDATRKAFVIGHTDDRDLATALAGALCSRPDEAAVLLVVLANDVQLAEAIRYAMKFPRIPIWCVYGKGQSVTVADSTIRAAMRNAGLIDSKSCSVSDKLTATRYRKKS